MITLLISHPEKLTHALGIATKTLGYLADGFSSNGESDRKELAYVNFARVEIDRFIFDLRQLGVSA